MGRVGARERLGGLPAVASLNFNHYTKALVSVAAKLGVRVSTYGFWDVIQSIAYGTIPFIRHPWELHFVRRISSCWGWGTGRFRYYYNQHWEDLVVRRQSGLDIRAAYRNPHARSSVPQKAHTHVGSHVPLLYMLNNTWPVGKAGENSTRPPCNIVVTCVCKNVCEGEQARARASFPSDRVSSLTLQLTIQSSLAHQQAPRSTCLHLPEGGVTRTEVIHGFSYMSAGHLDLLAQASSPAL